MDANSTLESGVTLTPRCQWWYIGEIRELLSEGNISTLRESCLGHLLDVGEIQFQGEILKLLCRRLHSNSIEKNSLIFNLGDHVVEFGPSDYCVMTGLKFSGDISLPTYSKFHDAVFKYRHNLLFGDIEKEFRKECEVSGGKSVRSLKLAYLILIYGFMVFSDLDSGKLDLGYMHLMDNLEKFNAFPWGVVSYQFLVNSTHRLKRELASMVKDGHTKTLEAYGFLYALQCWSYEVVPALGTFCASLNTEHLSSFPRLLKWIVSRNLTFENGDLRKFFLAEHGCKHVHMTLTMGETQKIRELGVTPSMRGVSPPVFVDVTKHVGRRLEFGSRDGEQSNTKKQSSKRKNSRLGSSPTRSTPGKRLDVDDCSVIEPKEFKTSMAKYNRKRKGACNIGDATPQSESISNTNFLTPEGATVTGDAKLNEITTLLLSLKGQIKCLEEYVAMKFLNFEVFMEKRRNGCGCSCKCRHGLDVWDWQTAPRQIPHINPNTLDCASHTPKASAAGVICTTTKRSGVSSDHVVGLSIYDPNESDMAYAEMEPFDEWYHDPLNYKRENEVMLPTKILQYGDLAWFKTLLRSDGWLESLHIDALINLLIINFDKKSSTTPRRNWTCLEICCWESLTKPNFVDILPVLLPYVHGERPLSGGLRWCEVEHIFGIANIRKNHWVFFDVSLDEQLITVYNSLVQDWDMVLSHFDNVRKHLPIICRVGGLWDSSRKPLKSKWGVVNYSQAPKQVNVRDCGIMAMKFMECCAYQVSVMEINPKRCEKSRQRYCAKLFELSKELLETAPAPVTST